MPQTRIAQGQPAQHISHTAIRNRLSEHVQISQMAQLNIEAEQHNTQHPSNGGDRQTRCQTGLHGHPGNDQQTQRVNLLQLNRRLQ